MNVSVVCPRWVFVMEWWSEQHLVGMGQWDRHWAGYGGSHPTVEDVVVDDGCGWLIEWLYGTVDGTCRRGCIVT